MSRCNVLVTDIKVGDRLIVREVWRSAFRDYAPSYEMEVIEVKPSGCCTGAFAPMFRVGESFRARIVSND